MSFAIVELKYMEKKYFIVRTECIKNYNPKKALTESFFCFISTDMSEDANFEAAYYQKFVGESGLFKVFVRKVTGSLEEAILWQKNKRMNSVSKKLRIPTNTDVELNTQLKIRKKNEKKIQDSNKINANVQNTSHLVRVVKAQAVPSIPVHCEKPKAADNLDTVSSALANLENGNKNAMLSSAPSSTINISTSSLTASNNQQKQSIVYESDYDNMLPLKSSENPIVHIFTAAVDATFKQSSDNKKESYRGRTVVDVRKQSQNEKCVLKTVKDTKATSGSSGVEKSRLFSSPALNLIDNVPTRIEDDPKQLVRNIQYDLESESNSKACKRLATSSESDNDITKKRQTVPGNPISTSAELINIRQFETELKKLRKENSTLKSDNQKLSEKNTALQTALVICTKAIPKELSFEEKDGGRLYNCGVFLNRVQCEVLDSIVDDREYCNGLITAVFGSDTLKKSSVKGAVSNRTKAPAKDRLDPKDLKFVYDIMAIRTSNSIDFTTAKINKIINKKISNLLASERGPRTSKKKLGDAKSIDNDEDDSNQYIYEDENLLEEETEAEGTELNVEENVGEEGHLQLYNEDFEIPEGQNAQYIFDENSYYLFNVPCSNELPNLSELLE